MATDWAKKVLLSYEMNTTLPSRPLWAEYDSLTGLLEFEAHSPTSTHQWRVGGLETARDLWDAMMTAKRDHEGRRR